MVMAPLSLSIISVYNNSQAPRAHGVLACFLVAIGKHVLMLLKAMSAAKWRQ